MIKWLRSNSPKDCLFILNQFEGGDILIYEKPAVENDFVLVYNIKKLFATYRVNKDKKMLAQDTDEFALTPISPKNLVDQILFDTDKKGI
jgi:hypothetical protein